MRWNEFQHFLDVAQISKNAGESVIWQIFIKPLESEETEAIPGIPKCLYVFEFIQALLLFARYKYGHLKHRNGANWSCSDCLKRFLDECILPMERTVTSGEVRELLETVHVKNKVVRQYREALRIVFEFYRQHTDGEKRRKLKDGLMDFDSFSTVFYHAGLLPMDSLSSGGMKGRSQSSNTSLLKEVFGFPQRDEHFDVSVFGKTTRSEFLSSGEFVEAVAKFGVLHWHKVREALHTKIARIFRAVAMLTTHLGYSRHHLQLSSLGFDSEELICPELEEIDGVGSATTTSEEKGDSLGVGGIFKMTEHAHEGVDSARGRGELQQARVYSSNWISSFREEENGSIDAMIDFGIGVSQNERRNSFTSVASLLKGVCSEPPPVVAHRLRLASEQIESGTVLQRREQTMIATPDGTTLTGGGKSSCCAILPTDVVCANEESMQETEDRKVHGLTEPLKRMPKKSLNVANRLNRRL
eukprot:gb/GECG01015343.1/.p1 GENE.gb/GECG01015343.1/~~gb/GECG01015343.1/.p1  ORF type:complete len:471 (+),score=65.75 gb/GECG01015343.1/:1-1413(+)